VGEFLRASERFVSLSAPRNPFVRLGVLTTRCALSLAWGRFDEAEDIVNAVGPGILAEFQKQDERRGFAGWFDRIKRRR